MARYTGPDCRQCRREGEKLFLKGEKCYSEKCPFAKNSTPPGQHGADRKKNSEYATQLREKQKTKRIYGLCEKQFRGYYDKAEKMRGITGENMLILLERRLDNTVYRLGLASSRSMARQIVNHGHCLVNDKKVDIPSYLLKEGDVITIKDSSKKYIQTVVESIDMALNFAWITVDSKECKITFDRVPNREEMDPEFKEQLVIEYYSK